MVGIGCGKLLVAFIGGFGHFLPIFFFTPRLQVNIQTIRDNSIISHCGSLWHWRSKISLEANTSNDGTVVPASMGKRYC